MLEMVGRENFKNIVEPSCGDGIFCDCMLEHFPEPNITAVEIASFQAHVLRNRYRNVPNVEVVHDDFFHFYENTYGKKEFDLIIGNPPFIRYQNLPKDKREEYSTFFEKTLSQKKCANIYFLFLVCSIRLLANTGKICFVVPQELVQAAYAKDIRRFLEENLQKITLCIAHKRFFPDIEQNILILLGEKGGAFQGIRHIEIRSYADFQNIPSYNFQTIESSYDSWAAFTQTDDEKEIVEHLRSSSNFYPFSDIAKTSVGITSGNNAFFLVNKRTCTRYDLFPYAVPFISKYCPSVGIYFTGSDVEKYVEEEKKTYILLFPKKDINFFSMRQQEYIRCGEQKQANRNYKCAKRNFWYSIPSFWISDAFLVKLVSSYPRLVINNANAACGSTIHRVQFTSDILPEYILLAFYSSPTFASIELFGKKLGGGLLDIPASQIAHIYLPKITSLSALVVHDTLKQIDTKMRVDSDIEEILDLVDQTLGIDTNFCKMCRKVWRNLREKRIKH